MDKQGAVELWEKASQLIRSDINSVSYDNWFKDLKPADYDGQTLTLLAANAFNRNILTENYSRQLQAALNLAAGHEVSFVLRLP